MLMIILKYTNKNHIFKTNIIYEPYSHFFFQIEMSNYKFIHIHIKMFLAICKQNKTKNIQQTIQNDNYLHKYNLNNIYASADLL